MSRLPKCIKTVELDILKEVKEKEVEMEGFELEDSSCDEDRSQLDATDLNW